MSTRFQFNEIKFESGQYSFLKIGEHADQVDVPLHAFKNSRYHKIKDLWGTLGWANDRPLIGSGVVEFSREGNTLHRGATSEITALLFAQNVEIDAVTDIRERFIDLSQWKVENLPESIRSEEELYLRFELFLEKDEGALLYLQENPLDDVNAEDAVIRLITPESTDKHFSQNRYSLTYRFIYTFGKQMERAGDCVLLKDRTAQAEEMRTALKVLTFKRNEEDPRRYFRKAAKNLNELPTSMVHGGLNMLGEKKYGLYRYENGQFLEVNAAQLDRAKRTVLLIHGTFSSVEGSFGELLQPLEGEQHTFFDRLQLQGNEQIIGFNHPTASHSVCENVDWLLKLLGDRAFEHPVDIVTTSRGVLVAEKLVTYDKAYRILQVRKVLAFAPAHGSDLLLVAKGLDHFLSFLKSTTSKTAWGYVLALAQFSVNAIRTQPGLDVMLPGSDELTKIMSGNPVQTVHFKAMVGQYDGELIDKWFKRQLANGLDALLWLAFRSENDWVIGCPEQRKQMHGINARYDSNYEYSCIHGKQFDPDHPMLNGTPADVRAVMLEYLKA